MRSPRSELPDLLGAQRPRICCVPDYAASAGAEAVELARVAGLGLDPWEEFVLANALGERPDGRWAAFEVGVVVSRQNGKGTILEARELAGLFLLGERLIIHSAHQFDTSLEAFRRLLMLVEETPDFDRRVKRVSRSHGEEGIELKGGQRIRFRTRTKGGGRGFSGDCLILDEAMILPESAHGALLPTLSARPNPQVWYTGSAVDQEIHEHGVVLARLRDRGQRGEDPGLAYFEWSLPRDHPDEVEHDLALDPEAWASTNPGLGIRISTDHVANEQRSMDPRTFAVERLGVGDWPRIDGHGPQVIAIEAWRALTDTESTVDGPVCFAFDVTPDRSRAAIAVAGTRDDGLAHVEIVDHKRGTSWVAVRVAELVEQHETISVQCDASGPAASLLPELHQLGVEVQPVSSKEHAQACGVFFDDVHQQQVRHLGTPELDAAIKGAAQRPLTLQTADGRLLRAQRPPGAWTSAGGFFPASFPPLWSNGETVDGSASLSATSDLPVATRRRGRRQQADPAHRDAAVGRVQTTGDNAREVVRGDTLDSLIRTPCPAVGNDASSGAHRAVAVDARQRDRREGPVERPRRAAGPVVATELGVHERVRPDRRDDRVVVDDPVRGRRTLRGRRGHGAFRVAGPGRRRDRCQPARAARDHAADRGCGAARADRDVSQRHPAERRRRARRREADREKLLLAKEFVESAHKGMDKSGSWLFTGANTKSPR
jgi:hypothetical protein